MGDRDGRRWVVADLLQRRPPFGDRHHHGLVEADLPAVFLRRIAHRVGDDHAVVLRAGDDGDLPVRRLPLAGVVEVADELHEALAVPVLGGVGHEVAEVELGIVAYRLVMHDVGVVVDIGHTGIGDRVVFRRHGAGVVAVDDGVHLVTVEQALHRRDDVVGALLLAVFEDRRERPAEDAAHHVDLFAGELEPALERETVGGGPAGERHAAADRDRLTLCTNTIVDVGQQAARHGGGAKTGKPRALHEVAPARDEALARSFFSACSTASDDHGRFPPSMCAGFRPRRGTSALARERSLDNREPFAAARCRRESARLCSSSQLGNAYRHNGWSASCNRLGRRLPLQQGEARRNSLSRAARNRRSSASRPPASEGE